MYQANLILTLQLLQLLRVILGVHATGVIENASEDTAAHPSEYKVRRVLIIQPDVGCY